MMIANFANGRLLNLMGRERIFRLGTWALAFFGRILSLCAGFGLGGIWGLVVPVFFYMSMSGFIVANSVAGALAHFPQRAGLASSLLGAMHYGSGMLSAARSIGYRMGRPEAWVMGGAGVGSLATALISHAKAALVE